jgi:addiction module HigA family antidote
MSTTSISSSITEEFKPNRNPPIYIEELTMARQTHRPAIHPGEILREDTLPALKMSVSAAAAALGVSRKHLHKILAEEAPISAEMAVRLGKFCGNGPDIWMRLQAAYDVATAERALARVVRKIPTAKLPDAA